MVTCTKRFADIPFAHRQHTHPGHCRFIHGHNWAFEFTFVAREVDACGFVLDFGGPEMKGIKMWINDMFDHKLLLNELDPMRRYLLATLNEFKHSEHPDKTQQLADITVVPDASSEGLAKFLFKHVNDVVYQGTRGRVSVLRVRVYEDEKNSATFEP